MSEGIIQTEENVIIETPERVPLTYALASIGNRFLAVAIDHLLQFILLIIVILLFSSVISTGSLFSSEFESGLSETPKWLIALLLIIIFLVWWGYFTFFEWFWHGQTPGKKLLRLRVVREDGRPITLWEAITRNLLRLLDSAPGFGIPIYSVGLITIFLSTKDQRIGDIFAGTLVIRERADEAPTFEETFSSRMSDTALIRTQLPVTFTSSIRGITDREIEVVESLLRRRWDLSDRQREWMAWRVALPLMMKIKPDYDTENFTYEGFLEELLHSYQVQRKYLN